MEIENGLEETYETGRILEVDRGLVERGLAKAERILGLEPQKYDFRLRVFPENDFQGNTIGTSNFITGDLGFPERVHEAVIAHEAAHYVMGKRGMKLGRDPKNWTFHNKLVRETFAETVAGLEYGYRMRRHRRVGERPSLEERKRELETSLKERPEPSSQIALRQRILELDYFSPGSWTKCLPLSGRMRRLVGLAPKLFGFTLYLDSGKLSKNPEERINAEAQAIMDLAFWNAHSLAQERSDFDKLVERLKERVRRKGDPTEFYFEEISSRVVDF